MTNAMQRRRLVLAAALCGALGLPLPAGAIQIVELSAHSTNSAGNLTNASHSITAGKDTNGGATVVHDAGFVAGEATFELEPITDYVRTVDQGQLSFLGDTHWWSKTTAHLFVDPSTYRADVDVATTRTRVNEKYAVYAVAPNSASGFIHDAEPSANGGPGIRVNMLGYFNGGIYTEHFSSDPNTPHFFIGAEFGDSVAGPVEPDFATTLAAYNVGFHLVIDLDAAGVAMGDDYTFFESYSLGIGPGVTLNGLETAFVDIDP